MEAGIASGAHCRVRADNRLFLRREYQIPSYDLREPDILERELVGRSMYAKASRAALITGLFVQTTVTHRSDERPIHFAPCLSNFQEGDVSSEE